jgi:hypothetical protein
VWAGMARDQQVICLKRQWKYFCEGGWTGVSVICPPRLGKNREHF